MKFLERIGIDKHIFHTLLYRGWNILVGMLVVFIIPTFFTSNVQGYYFTFSSLVASQVFFELGLNFVITQIVAHESIGIKLGNNGSLSGDQKCLDRISSLLNLVKKWYSFISILFLVLVAVFGFMFFDKKGILSWEEWAPAWLLHVLFTSVNLFLSPYFSILEGFGRVADAAKTRFIQSFFSYILFSIMVINGFGLYSIVAISGASAFIGSSWLLTKYRYLLHGFNVKYKFSISWKEEVFPFQWKIAVSWISGYFIFQLFNPLMFAHQGADAAGQMGLSMSIFSTLLSLAMGWVTAKTPVVAQLIAAKKIIEAKKIFFAVMFRSALLNVFLGIGFILFSFGLNFFNLSMASRILPIGDLILILVTTMINQLIFSMASYMRAHKEEPLLLSSVCVAILTIASVYVCSFYGATTVLAGYVIVLLCAALPWTYVIFTRYSKK